MRDEEKVDARRFDVNRRAKKSSRTGYKVNLIRLAKLIEKKKVPLSKIDMQNYRAYGWIENILRTGNATSGSIVMLADYFGVDPAEIYVPMDSAPGQSGNGEDAESPDYTSEKLNAVITGINNLKYQLGVISEHLGRIYDLLK